MATGELGPKPFIFVWDSETLEVTNQWKGAILKGIAALAFSPSGKKLVAAAIDDDHYIGVFDLGSNAAMSFKGGKDVIVDIDWATETSFVTIGVKHFKLWNSGATEYKATQGQFGKANNLLSGLCFVGNQTLVGAASGDL